MTSEMNALNLEGMLTLGGSIGDEELGRLMALENVSVDMSSAMAVAVGEAAAGPHKTLGQIAEWQNERLIYAA